MLTHFPTSPGVLVMTHQRTGAFFLAVSNNLRKSAFHAKALLAKNEYHSPELQRLVTDVGDVIFAYHETSTRNEARKKRHELMLEHYGDAKLLNQQDWPKTPGMFILTHKPTGKFFIGHSGDLVKQVKYITMMLRTGNHKNEELLTLYQTSEGIDDFSWALTFTHTVDEAKKIAHTEVLINEHNPNLIKRGRGVIEKPRIGAYRITHKPTGQYYVGSSKDVTSRWSSHKWQLRNYQHKNQALQSLFSGDMKVFELDIVATTTRDEAYDIEQRMLDAGKYDPLCLNIAGDGRSSITSIEISEESKRRQLEALRKHSTDPAKRAYRIKRIKEAWSDPERRAARTGANNKDSKPIWHNGKHYASVNQALKATQLSIGDLYHQLKDPNNKDVYYAEGTKTC